MTNEKARSSQTEAEKNAQYTQLSKQFKETNDHFQRYISQIEKDYELDIEKVNDRTIKEIQQHENFRIQTKAEQNIMKRDNLRLKGEKLQDLRLIESTKEDNNKYKVITQ